MAGDKFNQPNEYFNKYAMRSKHGFTGFTRKLFVPDAVMFDQDFDINMDNLLALVSGQSDSAVLRETYVQAKIPFIENEGNLISSGAVIELCSLMCEESLKDRVLGRLKKENVEVTTVLKLLKQIIGDKK